MTKTREYYWSEWSEHDTAEKLVDIEERFQLWWLWRFRHVMTVKRIIGLPRGTGGSLLARALDLTFCPELWDVGTDSMLRQCRASRRNGRRPYGIVARSARVAAVLDARDRRGSVRRRVASAGAVRRPGQDSANGARLEIRGRVHQIGVGEDHLRNGVELGGDMADARDDRLGAAIEAHLDEIAWRHARPATPRCRDRVQI